MIEENVNLCDLFATLCELADIPAPSNLDSRSLVPLLHGADGDWDNESISQFGLQDLMIKRDALKYQWYGTDYPEVLFDLERDPAELTNLASDPACRAHMERFRARRDELGYAPSSSRPGPGRGANIPLPGPVMRRCLVDFPRAGQSVTDFTKTLQSDRI